MRATDWEFKNRGIIFGFIFGLPFLLTSVDQVNAASAVAAWLAGHSALNAYTLTRELLALGALLMILSAGVRTWASSYLNADVVYASEVKSAALVADGPYRQVRNPLYLGNVLMGLSFGALMSRLGFVVMMVALVVFCYRLILREEMELLSSQGGSFRSYLAAVPRLLPSPWPRVPSAGRRARWGDGLVAESWCWGFAVAMVVFAATLSNQAFFILMGISLVAFYGLSAVVKKSTAVTWNIES